MNRAKARQLVILASLVGAVVAWKSDSARGLHKHHSNQ